MRGLIAIVLCAAVAGCVSSGSEGLDATAQAGADGAARADAVVGGRDAVAGAEDAVAGAEDAAVGAEDAAAGAEDAAAGAEDAAAGAEDAAAGAEDAVAGAEDAATPDDDARVPAEDATSTDEDAMTPDEDATTPDEDAATPADDAGLAADDATTPADDAGLAPDAAADDAAADDAAADDAAPAPDAAAPDAAAPDALPIDAGFTTTVIIDENGNPITITNGPAGLPTVVGCSDGQREGFVDDSVQPNRAGCLGTWMGTPSLRSASSTVACGDDLGPCPSPANLCAQGWHICGASGLVQEVRDIGPTECLNAGGGRYVTAISHCQTQSGCVYDTTPTANYACYPTGWCSEPVCCGLACQGFGACPSGVWPSATHIPVGTDQGCGAMSSRRAGGVICCRD